jgi:hypothetical protein
VRREGLQELRDWLDGFWDDALEAFKAQAERSEQPMQPKGGEE